jgi:lipopolysaccharide export system protein LptC
VSGAPGSDTVGGRHQLRVGRSPASPVLARRSRFVGLMKWVLPAVALALVAIVVVWPEVSKRAPTLLLTIADVDVSGPTIGMVKARYVGMDRNDQPFVITAEQATPRAEDRDAIDLNQLQADIALSDGRWLALSARTGLYHRTRETLSLEGPVTLFSDDGFQVNAERADVDLATGVVVSDAPIEGQGPLGHLSARSFKAVDRGQRLFFQGDVRMTIYPGTET